MRAIEYRTVGPAATLREALEALNQSGKHLTALVVDNDHRLIGSLTDGDVRRAILGGGGLEMQVKDAMNTSPHVLTEGQGAAGLVRELSNKGIRSLPIVDTHGRLIRMIDLTELHSILPVRALIMAGGRGMRLRPYTDSTPKPLIPVRGKPIIEHILDLLSSHGVEDVSISVNYLKEKIMEHLGNGEAYGLRISYLLEELPLGTAGALGTLENPGHEAILMMNSDLLTDIDLEAMYTRFIHTDADLVVATTEHMVELPYAVLDLHGERVSDLKEKPTLSFPCNAGIYMLNRRILASIPADVPYNATDLIHDLLDRRGRVMSFPIAGYWYDIGKHDDLARAGQGSQ